MKYLLAALTLAFAAPALAAPPRPAADIERDATRKPSEMLAFAKVKPGDKVADFLPGGGYFTRLFAAAVAPGGSVVAIIPAQATSLDPAAAKAVTDMAADKSYGNISVVPAIGPEMAGTFDVIWTAQNYHDMHAYLPPEAVVGFNKGVFAALKSGGYFVIVDHSAAPGSPAVTTAKSLHRIDPAVVRADLAAAGLVFDGETSVLANPTDPKTAVVFDPAIRGKTDQFVYRFRKP
jgi:predicted methyltransferase